MHTVKKFKPIKKRNLKFSPVRIIQSKKFFRVGAVNVEFIKFLFDEEELKQPSNQSLLSIFFDYHQIIKSKKTNYCFEFEIRNNNIEMPTDYMVQRFKSYGNQYFHDLAVELEQYKQINHQISKFSFPTIQKYLEQQKGNTFFLFQIDKQGGFKRLFLSENFNKFIGLGPEELQLACTKYRGAANNFFCNGDYPQNILGFAKQINSFFKQLSSQQQQLKPSERQVVRKFRTTQNMILKTECVLSFPTPDIFIIKIVNILEQIPSMDIMSPLKAQNEIQFQQYEILQYLLPINKNKLKNYQDKVCGYRQIISK